MAFALLRQCCFCPSEVKAAWPLGPEPYLVYKVLFANFDRLDQAAAQLANDPSCKAARAALEKNARNLLNQLLSR